MDIGSHHASGMTVAIVGIESGTNSRSCYKHDIRGSVIGKDVNVRTRKLQVMNNIGKEETAITAFHITAGIDHCYVGFLPHHFVPQASSFFDGVLAQVVTEFTLLPPVKVLDCAAITELVRVDEGVHKLVAKPTAFIDNQDVCLTCFLADPCTMSLLIRLVYHAWDCKRPRHYTASHCIRVL